MVDIAANYRSVLQRIEVAAARHDRNPKEIKLLAASKSQSVTAIEAAIGAGISLIGENYVQEARDKKKAIKARVEWHMIGHLQRNKAKTAVEIFDLIQSLDSVALARALDQEGRKRERRIRTFIEVNLGGEDSKSGVPWDQLETLLSQVGTLAHVAVEGLMAVPPYREDPEQVRPYFRALKELQSRLRRCETENVQLRELSMGMTHDYMVAIEEGATMVRIGTALFGPREG